MPLEFQYKRYSDFSGGMTDNYMSGPDNTFQLAENYFLTKLGTLETTWGFTGIKSGAIGGLREPISGLYQVGNDTMMVKKDSIFSYNIYTDTLVAYPSESTQTIFDNWDRRSTTSGFRYGDILITTHEYGSFPAMSFINDLSTSQTSNSAYFLGEIDYVAQDDVLTYVISNETGTAGNSISFTGDGVKNLLTLCSENNCYIPDEYAIFTARSIPKNGQVITLSGGTEITYGAATPITVSCGLPKPTISDYFKVTESANPSHSFSICMQLWKRIILQDGTSVLIVSPPSDVITAEQVFVEYSDDVKTNGFPEIGMTSNYGVALFRTNDNGTTYRLEHSNPAFSDSATDEASSVLISSWTTSVFTLYTDNSDSMLIFTDPSLDYTRFLYPAPECKYVFGFGNISYYCNVTNMYEQDNVSEGELDSLSARVYQSVPMAPWSIGIENYITLDAACTGGGAFGSVPVVFTLDKTYRIDGKYGIDGTGYMNAIPISNGTGCVDNASIVSTTYGLFFASEDGFYQTDGYTIKPISQQLEERYRQSTIEFIPKDLGELFANDTSSMENIYQNAHEIGEHFKIGGIGLDEDGLRRSETLFGEQYRDGEYLVFVSSYTPDATPVDGDVVPFIERRTMRPNGRERIIGAFEKSTKRIWWRVNDNEIWVYDLNFGAWTSMKSGRGLEAMSMLSIDGNMLRGDAWGNLFEHSRYYYSFCEQKNTPVSQWPTYAIPVDFKSNYDHINGDAITKWGYGINFEARIHVGSTIRTWSNNDVGKKTEPMKEAQHHNTLTWGSDDFIWGDPDFVWRAPAAISAKRRFPKGTLRFKRKQIGIDTCETELEDSGLLGTVSTSLRF